MKKFLWLFLSLSLLFSACNKEENISTPNLTNKVNEVSFYGVATPDVKLGQQGVVQTNKLWHPAAIIDVRFLNGTAADQELIKTHVKEWEELICVRFNFIESGDAEVRIAFNWQSNKRLTWSFTGTDCKFVTDQSQPTMNIANWQSSAKTPEIKKGDVLRLFGQVLGLEYEYRHLEFNPMWGDELDVEDYWMTYLRSFVEWDEFKKYVYNPLQASKVIQTAEYDAKSIMVMPINDDWVTENPELLNATANNSLSAKDIEFIQLLYPSDACKEEDDAIITVKVSQQAQTEMALKFTMYNNNIITIDWGDSSTQEVQGDYYVITKHTYANQGNYTIKVYGGEEDLKMVSVGYSNAPTTTALDVSKNKKLKDLTCRGGQLEFIDLTHNLELENVDLSSNKLISLILPETKKIITLNCGNNNITSLDLSGTTQLTSLSCSSNDIEFLDISQCSQLGSLHCDSNLISQLDFSYNTNLQIINCSGNQLTQLDFSMNPLLTQIYASANEIEDLNVRNCNLLEILDITGSQDSSKTFPIDLSNNPNLHTLLCGGKSIKNVDVSNNPLLNYLSLTQTSITSLDLSHNFNLSILSYLEGPIQEVDIAQNLKLKSLSIGKSNITTLDISNNPQLEVLAIQFSSIESVFTSNNSQLNMINLRSTPLSQNKTAMLNLVQQLPNRTGFEAGKIYDAIIKEEPISSICAQKNWIFL